MEPMLEKPKALVIIPTYNEADNVPVLLPELLALDLPVQLAVLVVDDNSPDGTAAEVEKLQTKFTNRVFLLKREKKNGLGRAYLAGFAWGLQAGYDFLVQMDADFSHRPQDLTKIFQALVSGDDLAVGSRYCAGGGVAAWSLMRKLISRGGSLYSRFILGFNLNDWTGGFNGWSAGLLKLMNLDSVQSEGYSFQIELKYRALVLGARVLEVPILFEDRREGQSKMSFRIVVEALYRVWLIRFGHQKIKAP